MSLIRPEAARGLKRWAEPVAAAAVVVLGMTWGLTGLGVMRWLGVILIGAGLAFLVLGVRRARFWGGAGGPGHVEVDEGAIAYFASDGAGGAMPIGGLRRIELRHRTDGQRFWTLSGTGAPVLSIPVNASGTEALFDVFANLPGIDMQALLRHLNGAGIDHVVIWIRNDAPLH